MRRTLLILAAILIGTGATAAMPLARPCTIGSGLLAQKAAVVCGGNGCAPVQTSAARKRVVRPLGR